MAQQNGASRMAALARQSEYVAQVQKSEVARVRENEQYANELARRLNISVEHIKAVAAKLRPVPSWEHGGFQTRGEDDVPTTDVRKQRAIKAEKMRRYRARRRAGLKPTQKYLTPQQIDTIKRMAFAGSSAKGIAAAINRPPACVYAAASKRGIRLGMSRRLHCGGAAVSGEPIPAFGLHQVFLAGSIGPAQPELHGDVSH
jgi:hypothetical protein